MTTLNEIITTIDEKLDRAQCNSPLPISSRESGEYERMCRYILIVVDDEKLAIPIGGIAEIGPLPEITPLPNLPGWIYGIINQRGEIVSMIDLPMLLVNRSTQRNTPAGKFVVLQNNSMKVGIVIDQIVATVSLPESAREMSRLSIFSQAAPDVFEETLQVDSQIFTILKPDAFLELEGLMQYGLPA